MSDILDKIIEAKEKMGENAIEKIVKHYNLENYSPERKSASCPFHADKTPSLIWNDKDKAFKCFSCSRRISILDMYIETEGSYSKAVKKLCNETGVSIDIKSIERNKDDYFVNYKYPKPEQNKTRDIVEQYCAKRGISKRTLDYMGVKQDPHGNVTFEFHDLDGTLVCKKYRLSKKAKNGMPKMWWDKDSDNCPVLYNIDKVDITKPMVITEGNYDTLSVFESGYTNVVSIPGGAEDSNWIDFNYEFLENVENIILWFDNDKAGQDGLKKVVSRLGEYRCRIVKPSKEDEDAVERYYKTFSKSSSIRKTDANNILLALGGDRVLSLINSAEEIPNKKLKYLMDCADKNIAEQEKFSFGINEMDKILYGNLFSCFTIYSGVAGSGKSSLTNTTALISAVENGYKVFSFSGELSDGQLADWVVNCLAGYNHVRKIPGVIKDGNPYYVTTKEAEQEIRKYYKRSMILYSDDDSLDISGDSLLFAMEDAYKRYGCKIFNIDNMMCVSFEDTNDDKWLSQKHFIIKLMGFAKKYDVCVNLVLHPKKMPKDQKGVSTSDLYGASEIGNLCHRMIWVERLEEDEKGYDTKVTIIKDRPTGKAGKSCKLYYDNKTRRFYSTNDELRKTYRWEKDCNIKYPPDIEKDLIKNDPVNSLPNEPCNYDPDSPY